MKTLYLECLNGAAGDMIAAALYELISDKKSFIKKMNSLGLSGVKVNVQNVKKSGIKGYKFNVAVGGHCESNFSVKKNHKSKNLQDINKIVAKLPVSEFVKKNTLAIYNILARAEAKVHGVKVSQIHFHEIGNLDAIADIAAACILIETIAPDNIVASPVNAGGGFVKCSHGTLPVPAPATAELLKDIPVFSGKIKSELCTPTGAAIIKHFAKNFRSMPEIKIKKTGYGFGSKEFKTLNCVRAFLGESLNLKDVVVQLECNLDDATGEEVGYACELLLRKGALDAFVLPVFMKKNRPGFWLFCLCKRQDADKFAQLMLKHTSSLGVRETVYDRYILERKLTAAKTPYGKINIKTGVGYGVKKSKCEYEDVAKAAKKSGVSLNELKQKIRKP
ncbi:nickel pincer cofactor biosynthesis protein LarC [Endomicrobium proavitum]|uniref:Putative nickel insertion protein n=1 Tax=Endomicrobium proavitum TaxID=1408281 RepID=A0A0G3WJT9_9BACT|nr:nickel pincer cofactor biosynthesis protein LarC [Endomicrobium proavitum]AKL98558.1 hypothetical protein Epro_1179 [Endomicrobium proavitum]